VSRAVPSWHVDLLSPQEIPHIAFPQSWESRKIVVESLYTRLHERPYTVGEKGCDECRACVIDACHTSMVPPRALYLDMAVVHRQPCVMRWQSTQPTVFLAKMRSPSASRSRAHMKPSWVRRYKGNLPIYLLTSLQAVRPSLFARPFQAFDCH